MDEVDSYEGKGRNFLVQKYDHWLRGSSKIYHLFWWVKTLSLNLTVLKLGSPFATWRKPEGSTTI